MTPPTPRQPAPIGAAINLVGVHLDFPGFFRTLAEIGYSGPITFESFSSAVVVDPLSSDLAIWRTQWSDSEDLARHAHGSLTTHLAANRHVSRHRA